MPEGWAWCRLGELSKLISKGTTPRGGKNAYTVIGVNYLRIENINDYGTIDLKNISHITEEEHVGYLKRSILQENDFIVSIAGTLGKTAIVRKQDLPLNTNQAVAFVRLEHFDILNLQFLRIIIESSTIKELLLKQTKVTSIPNLTLEIISSCFIPLPPLAEQRRIVAKIETIFAQIDLLEQNKVDLQTAVKQAKSKILDLAIRGKLVPQDPADEPAFVMLEKLRAEKEAKIAAGEIKRGKNDSYIYKNSTDNCYYQKYTDDCEKNISDEIPFDVPESWTWCRLPEVCRKSITDGTHNSPPNSDSGDFVYITAKNIKNLKIYLDDATYVSKEIHEFIYSRCSPELNDVLLTKDGTIGEVAVNNLNYPFSMLSSVALIKPSKGILAWFLVYVLISNLLQNKMKKIAKGSALKRIILAQINDFIIPLPPLAEQQRIVAKIEVLFAKLDFITAVSAE